MIYFNFLHAPSGGGLQNSASFLQTYVQDGIDLGDVCCFVFKGTMLESICLEHSIKHIAVSKGIIGKTIFELFFFLKIMPGDIVFSIFGPPLPFTEGKSINIGGMALSNVFYPEVNFWGYLSPLKRFFKHLKDRYRVYRYKRLDYWIFETELLADKAINIFNFPADRVSVVRMAPSALVSLNQGGNEVCYDLANDKMKVLLLCGAHPNKRHHLLPHLAKHLMEFGRNDIQFVFTACPNEYLKSVELTIKQLGVADFFKNIGPVEPVNVATLISQVDFVMNISLLESFSNNFVEAWAMKKPLITVSDEWAYSAAKEAALYIDVLDDRIQVESFISALNSDIGNVVTRGLSILEFYPDYNEKNALYIDAIKKAVSLGVLDNEARKGIKLK